MFAASKTASVSGGYQISRSLRFNTADSAYLNRTPATATNQQTWTWSGWFKRSSLGVFQAFFYQNTAPSDTGFFAFYLNTSDQIVLGGGVTNWRITTQVFRDPSAWYHMVVAVDTTQATANNRIRLYINGSEVTTFSTTNNPAQNANTGVNGTGPMGIGRDNSGLYFGGYQTECYLIDGTQLTPSSFGETNAQTGVWQPKAYSGSYGANGFYLNFSDNSNTTAATLGKDYSGNGNNWTPNNFSVTAGAGNDSLVDSPTSYGTDTGVGGTVRGNYATLNPLNLGNAQTLSNGNLDVTSSATFGTVTSTIGMSSGKWYYEVTQTAGLYLRIGLATQFANINSYLGVDTGGWAYVNNSGDRATNATNNSYGATWTTGDTIGIAFDADTGSLTFYKNGTSQGVAYTSLTSGPYFFAVCGYSASMTVNFGQRPFAYTAPSGFKALCTQNLPTPTIGATSATQAGKYFNPVLYTGNSTGQSITGVGFQPDWTWIKARGQVYYHILTDAVRGVNSQLFSNDTLAQETRTDRLTAFNSDGFTVGTYADVNLNGFSFVAWNWKANGSGSTNTAGSITSTVSANTTSGFSVVTYTGATSGTVGHGLGVSPAMIIAKSRSNTTDWTVYHQSLGINAVMVLSGTNPVQTISNYWGSSTPSSTVFGLWSSSGGNNTGTMVAYCFAPIAGYSAFGSYTGANNTGASTPNANGPFIYTGFRPRFVLIKRTSAAANWEIYDSVRGTYNANYPWLQPNLSAAETATEAVDFLSNGFKIRSESGATMNPDGGTFIYAAFAETPFKYSLAR